MEEHDLASGRNKNGWMHWPLVRGCRALVESLVLGYKALEIAAMHAFAEEEMRPRNRCSVPLLLTNRRRLRPAPLRPLGSGEGPCGRKEWGRWCGEGVLLEG